MDSLGTSVSEDRGNQDKVELSDSIIKYFSKRSSAHSQRLKSSSSLGTYFQDDEKDCQCTYDTIRGRDIEMVYDTQLDEMESPEEAYKIMRDQKKYIHKTKEDEKESNEAAEKALEFLFGPGKYKVLNKYLMRGFTSPVKIQYSKNGKTSGKPMFVKRPDTNRIAGKHLYEMISGQKDGAWGFHKMVFLEEGINGKPLSQCDETYLINNPISASCYKKGIAVAGVRAHYMGLLDALRPANRIVTYDFKTVLFDFDLLLDSLNYEHKEGNILDWALKFWKRDKELNSAIANEMNAVRKRITKTKEFFKFVEHIGRLVDTTGLTIDDRVKRYYDSKSALRFFNKRQSEFLEFYLPISSGTFQLSAELCSDSK
jgi:hypothetical protein